MLSKLIVLASLVATATATVNASLVATATATVKVDAFAFSL